MPKDIIRFLLGIIHMLKEGMESQKEIVPIQKVVLV